jgi:hypothetical protein
MRRFHPGAAILILFAAAAARADEPQQEPPPEAKPEPAKPEPPRPIVPPATGTLNTRNVPDPTTGEIPEWRIVGNSLTVFRWNPLGLESQLRFGVQKRLYLSDKPVLRDNFLHVGIYPRLNPAFLKFGPSIEFQPVSIFNLRAAVEYMQFFGSFGFAQSFPTPGATDYSDSALSRNRDAGLMYDTRGFHVMVEPFVQFKVGPIALRNRFALEYWNMKLRSGDKVFYEATLDTLVPADGWVITNDLDVIYQTKFKLNIGVRYTVVKPIYKDSDFLPGEEPNNRNGHHRLGLLAAYTFFDRGYTKFNKPTLLLISSWYLSHRWRTGTDTSAAIPYFILGFAFQTDLLQGG